VSPARCQRSPTRPGLHAIARYAGSWSLNIYNHEVVATQSPGLRYSATLGDGVVPRLSNGVAPTPTGLRRGSRGR
jgi:hypothetical protein